MLILIVKNLHSKSKTGKKKKTAEEEEFITKRKKMSRGVVIEKLMSKKEKKDIKVMHINQDKEFKENIKDKNSKRNGIR